MESVDTPVIYAKDCDTDDDVTKPATLRPNGHLSYIGRDLRSVRDLPLETSVNVNLVRRLDLSFNSLRSLESLARFANLEELILDNNDLADDDLVLPALHRLHTLTLNKNNVQVLSSLLDQIEQRFPRLTYLSLLGNDACPNQLIDSEKNDDDYRRYRCYALCRLPGLRFLDSTPISATERRQAKNATVAGQQVGVVRPDKVGIGIGVDDSSAPPPESGTRYTPLPSGEVTRRAGGGGAGAAGAGAGGDQGEKALYGKCKYVYYGKHSEGNRFIRNKDL